MRLSDGAWWKLVPTTHPHPIDPIGVSCEHAYYSYANQVLRVRLSSLPPGGLP
ncbi:MAG: hypothetical protein IT374_13415 [Polyangiaceae bacterium]|nr:hypothetical protein [Polyangiaceae bacterium]